ncbi:hypothetical protein C4K39_3352 [Pseudomonas sessilinigenes]|nr:hypothetical protein C4K39_3352 [Pseudomonas sessilinigenes]
MPGPGRKGGLLQGFGSAFLERLIALDGAVEGLNKYRLPISRI